MFAWRWEDIAMRENARFLVSLCCAAVLGLLSLSGALAHEERQVANDQYTFVVGFFDEPAIVGEKNALILEVTKPSETPASPEAGTSEDHEGVPVEGLAETLAAEVIYGDQRMTLELRPLFGTPGSYVGYFFPMAEGDYSFRVFGDVEGNAIDETFTSGPETFSPVAPREPLEFPKQGS
jgi:hypothetical protein